MFDLYIYTTPITGNNTNKSNVPTPEQGYSIKPPTEEMDLAVKSAPLAALTPPHGVYIDR